MQLYITIILQLSVGTGSVSPSEVEYIVSVVDASDEVDSILDEEVSGTEIYVIWLLLLAFRDVLGITIHLPGTHVVFLYAAWISHYSNIYYHFQHNMDTAAIMNHLYDAQYHFQINMSVYHYHLLWCAHPAVSV